MPAERCPVRERRPFACLFISASQQGHWGLRPSDNQELDNSTSGDNLTCNKTLAVLTFLYAAASAAA